MSATQKNTSQISTPAYNGAEFRQLRLPSSHVGLALRSRRLARTRSHPALAHGCMLGRQLPLCLGVLRRGFGKSGVELQLCVGDGLLACNKRSLVGRSGSLALGQGRFPRRQRGGFVQPRADVCVSNKVWPRRPSAHRSKHHLDRGDVPTRRRSDSVRIVSTSDSARATRSRSVASACCSSLTSLCARTASPRASCRSPRADSMKENAR
jgi:hypothetical protein